MEGGPSYPQEKHSSAFRGLHPQPTHQENRLLSYPEAVCTLVRTKSPAGELAPFQPALLVSLRPWDPVLPPAERGKGTVAKQAPKLTRALLTSLLAAEDGSYRERHGNNAFDLRPCKDAEGQLQGIVTGTLGGRPLWVPSPEWPEARGAQGPEAHGWLVRWEAGVREQQPGPRAKAGKA